MRPTTHRVLTALALAGAGGLDDAALERGLGLRAGRARLHLALLRRAGFVVECRMSARDDGSGLRVHAVTALGRAEARQRDLLPPFPSTWWPAAPFARARRRNSTGNTTGDAVGEGTAGESDRDGAVPPEGSGSRWPWPVMVRNHLLGGTLHRPVDRAEAARLRALHPDVDARARAAEADRGRLLRGLGEDGLVEQVLDLSTAVPAAGTARSAHVALAHLATPVPVVYVAAARWQADVAATVTRRLPHVSTMVADPRDAGQVWHNAVDTAAVHPGRPVLLDALTITDLVPDPRRLGRVLRAWARTVPAGSLLLLGGPLDPDLPEPFAVAARAGWHPLPDHTPPAPATARTGPCSVLVTRPGRSRRG